MRFLFHIWARLKRLKWREIFYLFILSTTIFCLAASLSCLDISTTSLLLLDKGILGFGINYLFAAFILIPMGYTALVLERRKGYGAANTAFFVSSLWLILTLTLYLGHQRFVYSILFTMKYGTIFLMNVAFWTLAARFLKISMSSLKFLGVFSIELFGILFGGILSHLLTQNTMLYCAIIGLFICTIFFKIIGLLFPISREVFIKKVGGVQDFSQKIMLDTILALSFCWSCTKLLIEYQIYHYIIKNDLSPLMVLGQLNIYFAGLCLAGLFCLAHTKFLYTTPLGLIICALSVGCCALGGIFSENWLILTGTVLFFATSHFYIHRYLSLLPRPLALGKGIRIKKLRWLVMTPCAFIFVGALLLTVSINAIYWILLAEMVFLALLFTFSSYLYGRELMKRCALRMWCGGPLMIAYPPLKQMLLQGLSKKNANEALYFLNFLDEGYTAEYRSILTQMLHHPNDSVRLFVLKKIRKLGLSRKEHTLISNMMKNDPSKKVRNIALMVLISDGLETNETTTWHKYKGYLSDKNFVLGACLGFFFGHGAWREKIVQKVQELASSKSETDHLIALSIMIEHPRKEWTEPIAKLLNSSSSEVMGLALSAAGKLVSPLLLNRLLPLLDEIKWRENVLETLTQYGKLAFPSIEKTILSDSAPIERQKELILFLGRLPSGEGKQILLRALFNSKRILCAPITESLSDSSIVWIHKDRRHLLKKAIYKTVIEWFDIKKILIYAQNMESEKLQKISLLFQDAIKEELERTRQLLLELLKLYTLQPLAHQALETLKGTNWNAFAGATSCLQDLLPKKIYKKVRPLLLYPTWNDPPQDIEQMPISTFLNSFVFFPQQWTTPWLKALALYGWGELNDKQGLVAIEEGLKSQEWIVLEAAISALKKIEKNKAKVEELILNVPTRFLLKQNLENILEENNAHHH